MHNCMFFLCSSVNLLGCSEGEKKCHLGSNLEPWPKFVNAKCSQSSALAMQPISTHSPVQ